MASLFTLTLLLYLSLSSATHHDHSKPPHFNQTQKPKPSLTATPSEIQQACKATRYPDTCATTVSQSSNLPQNPKPIDIIQSAISVSTQNLQTALSMAKAILDSSTGNPNRSTAAKNCLELLTYSEYRISSTVDVLPRGRIKDARAWMSAALLYQYDCWSALKYVNDTSKVNETMAFVDSLIGFTSNALSMIVSYDLFGNELGSWRPPMTERSGFWEDGSIGGTDLGFKGGFPSGLTPDVTVCKEEGTGCYKTVQSAVDAAPDNPGMRRFVIRIKEGVYQETVRVPFQKKNVVFLGDGMGKTVITGSLNVGQPGLSTYNTATVGK
uniref:Pectinesterase n=1 Tax=Nelumbo nucifera TaxID=4432 RepID=A0A822XZ06_NELNU|nr:TPA_asm: hypothetical protein HUJ06_024091 [Nelumbo nucifera]